ncbi:hypothetical protein [Enterococcus sp.]|jgi:hypothetical protein|uniref:hypothetical protein n=1 Tax=Enterococcus sp. TaxID=35783 RepID=UPI0025BD0A0E|nr:hypothetical protein [Enterococcus sp.]
MLLPSRTAVLNELYGEKELNVNQIMDRLKPIYGSESQFNKKLYVEHIMALEANGLVELTSYEVDEKDELVCFYRMTQEGRSTVDKYVDKKYRKA